MATICLAGLVLMRHQAHLVLREAMETADAAGVPRSFEAVRDSYWDIALTPGDNAAPLYEEAFDLYLFTEEDERVLTAVRTPTWHGAEAPLSEEVIEGIEPLLGRNADAIKVLQQAAALPYARFDLNFEDGFDLEIPHLTPLRNGARLLWLAAWREMEAGRFIEAAGFLEGLFGLADHVFGCDFAISYLTGFAISRKGTYGLEQLLMLHAPDATALREWSALLLAQESAISFARCIATEAASGSWVFEDPLRNLPRFVEMTSGQPGTRLPWRERVSMAIRQPLGMVDRDHAFFLQTVMARTRLTQEPIAYRMLLDPSAIDPENIPAFFTVSRVVTPRYRRMMIAEAECVARLRMMRVLLAAEALRQADGRLSIDLEAMLADQFEEEPVDPFTRRSFQLREEEGWLIVMTPGPNSDWSNEPQPLEMRLPLVR